MNTTTFLMVLFGLFTFFGATGFIFGVIKRDTLGGIPLGLTGLVIGLGGLFLLTR